MDQITISMDEFEEIQNRQRPHCTLNSYKEVIKTIKEIGTSKITVRTTVTNINVNEIVEWTRFLNEIRVKRVNFEPVSICGKGKENGLEDVNVKLFIQKYIEFNKYLLKYKELKMRLILNNNPKWTKKHLELATKYQSSYGITILSQILKPPANFKTPGSP